MAARISHFVTAATIFHVVLSTINGSSSMLHAALFLVELRWSVSYFLSFSVLLLPYIPNLWT